MKEGCTRIVFLIGNIAIKIPNFKYQLNHFLLGFKHNRSERKRYLMSRDENMCPSLICLLHGLILIQKRCKPIDRHLTLEESRDLFLICKGDIKKENFGILNNKLVCVDYA